MAKFNDLTGKRFGKLVVIRRVEDKQYTNQKHRCWECKCDCGNTKIVEGIHLAQGVTKHCGCEDKPHYIDLIGQRFGRWTVLRATRGRDNRKSRAKRWFCRCDCGTERSVLADSLLNGNSQSCGCLHNEITAEIGRRGKGIRRPSTSLGYGVSSFNGLHARYKRNAKKRNLNFELNKDEFKKITSENCFYCDVEPKQIFTTKNFFGEYLYNGIDRIDNEKGYSIDNCDPCCGLCNQGKNTLDKQYFIAWIEKVYNNLVEKKLILRKLKCQV